MGRATLAAVSFYCTDAKLEKEVMGAYICKQFGSRVHCRVNSDRHLL